MSQKEYTFISTRNEKITLVIDMADVDFIEKYENAFQKGQDLEKKLDATEPTGSRLRKMLKIYDAVIDDLFGHGTSETLFNGSSDYTLRTDVVSQIIAIAKKQQDEITNKHRSLFAKYKPSGK